MDKKNESNELIEFVKEIGKKETVFKDVIGKLIFVNPEICTVAIKNNLNEELFDDPFNKELMEYKEILGFETDISRSDFEFENSELVWIPKVVVEVEYDKYADGIKCKIKDFENPRKLVDLIYQKEKDFKAVLKQNFALVNENALLKKGSNSLNNRNRDRGR